MKIHLSLLAAVVLTGCTTAYPGGYGEHYAGNPPAPGSDAFCRNYAQQTSASDFEGNRETGQGSGGIAGSHAHHAGDRAYARCRAGKTN